MRGLPQKQNARRADKIRLCGHLGRYKKIVKKTYIISDKYQNSIYQNQSGAMKNSIIGKRNEFLTLSLEKQCRILKALVEYFRTGDIIDLRELGGSSQAGKVAMNKKIMGASELVLISQSPTGLFQQEIDLLKI